MLKINISSQTLDYYKNNKRLKTYAISTAKNGLGEVENSGKTPRGKHRIAQKIGAGCALGTVFLRRVATAEIYNKSLANNANRDWILSRILWLTGCEDFNQNSKLRFIYIHGTPDTEPMGVPRSGGCIRMRNDDVIELFDEVLVGEEVIIK